MDRLLELINNLKIMFESNAAGKYYYLQLQKDSQ